MNRALTKGLISAPLVFLSALWIASPASAERVDVIVRIENLSPSNGTFLTPLWVGFHRGDFNLYDRGSPASSQLEALAEDGEVGPLSTLFAQTTDGFQTTLFGEQGVIAPGEVVETTLTIENSAAGRFFSYASMIIPSNDAFIGNGNPMARPIFDEAGNFLGTDFIVLGSMVLDAGTEVNDEIPMNTAFFGQMMPNTGVDEMGVVELHPGFIPNGPILSDPRFANADFTAPGYQVARITVTPVPEPTALALLPIGCGLILLAVRRKRRAQASSMA